MDALKMAPEVEKRVRNLNELIDQIEDEKLSRKI